MNKSKESIRNFGTLSGSIPNVPAIYKRSNKINFSKGKIVKDKPHSRLLNI